MDDLLGEFLDETGEQIQELDVNLVRFEQDPNDAEMLNEILRVAHTIKGTCGFFHVPRLAKLSHAMETLLGRYRDGATVSAAGVTVILASLIKFKEILAVLARDGIEPDGTDDDLVRALAALSESGVGADGTDAATAGARPTEARTCKTTPQRTFVTSLVHSHIGSLELALQEGATLEDAMDQGVGCADRDDAAAPADMTAEGEFTGRTRASELHVPTVRVPVNTLETLMTTVSELVLARNQLIDLASRTEAPVFTAPLQRLSTVTTELQESVMKARLQPVAKAWQKLPVLVRTLAAELGKPIEIEMSGG